MYIRYERGEKTKRQIDEREKERERDTHTQTHTHTHTHTHKHNKSDFGSLVTTDQNLKSESCKETLLIR